MFTDAVEPRRHALAKGTLAADLVAVSIRQFRDQALCFGERPPPVWRRRSCRRGGLGESPVRRPRVCVLEELGALLGVESAVFHAVRYHPA